MLLGARRVRGYALRSQLPFTTHDHRPSLHRVHVLRQSAHGVGDAIGRAAHIALLDDEVLVRRLTYAVLHLLL